jgi:hypothetical protein
MAGYRLVTKFEMIAPIDRVWAALARPEDWVGRWAEVVDWDVLVARAGIVDARHRFALRASRLATLRFETRITHARRPDLIEWDVTGDVVGRGRWELDDLDEITFGRNAWEVRTTLPWLNLVAPAARRAYARRHLTLARACIGALADHVGADPLAIHASTSRAQRHRFANVALRLGPGASGGGRPRG